jgi:hypothetical protein
VYLSCGKESKESVKSVGSPQSLLFFPPPPPLFLPRQLFNSEKSVVGFFSTRACLLSLVWLWTPGLLRLSPLQFGDNPLIGVVCWGEV